MKAHQRAGDTLDEELDYYKDDDDVAVLFTLPDGKKVSLCVTFVLVVSEAGG